MRPWIILLAVALAVPAFTAGPAEGQASNGPHIEDPPDDARVHTVESFSNACWFGACIYSCSGCQTGGVEAPPGLELTGVTFDETEQDLIVRLEVEAFQDDFSDVAPEDGTTTQFIVCWSTQDANCREGVYVLLHRAGGAVRKMAATFQYQPGCGNGINCQWAANFTLQAGSPGIAEWRVPRALMPNASAGDTLEDPFANVLKTERTMPAGRVETTSEDDPPYLQSRYSHYQLTRNSDGEHTYLVDFAFDGDPFTFQTPDRSQIPQHLREDTTQDPADDFRGHERSDLDILGVRYVDRAHWLTVSFKMAKVHEPQREHNLWVSFGLGGNLTLLNAGYYTDGSRMETWGSLCTQYPCEDPADLAINVTFDPGEPGWVNLTFPRSETSLVGHRVSWMWAGSAGYADDAGSGPIDQAPVAGERHETVAFDSVGPGVAHRFGPDATPENTTDATNETGLDEPTADEPVQDRGVGADDPPDDANLPPENEILSEVDTDQDNREPAREDTFEITGVHGVGSSENTVKLTVSIADLSGNLTVPTGWDEMLYASAIRTDEGQFMAGYVKSEGGTGGSGGQKFFCSRDTAVFPGAPTDPSQVIQTPIQGWIRFAGNGQGQGGTSTGSGTTGSISYQVPHACLAGASGGNVTISGIGATTLLIRDRLDGPQVYEVDGLSEDLNATLTAPQIEPTSAGSDASTTSAPPPFWARPFGIENFWDIFGLAGGGLISLVGALFVRRRRSVLKRYLAEIDEIEEEHTDDASGRQAALRDLQDRAKDDLVDGRLTENQYVVVKDRVEESIQEARAEDLEEAFGDLPLRLLRRLKTMLADGRLSAEDRRLFSTLLEDSALTDAAKQRVRNKLDVWVDAS